MPNLYIFDLDGVLFDNSHRQHLLPTGDGATTEQWDAFNLACEDDEPIRHMWQMLTELFLADGKIRFLTGRSEVCRAQTIRAIIAAWTPMLGFDQVDKWLYMRPVDDHRRAAEFKYDEVKRMKFMTVSTMDLILIDDDPSIVDACRPLVNRAILVKPFSGCAALSR